MADSLLSLLSPRRIAVGLQAETKDEVLVALVELAARSEAVGDGAALLDAVRAREALMSTGVGQGIAFPHARTEVVGETVAAFATLASPVDFEALDDEPVRLVLLIAGAEGDRRGHVRLLSRASRVFAEETTRERLRTAKTPAMVMAAFEEAESLLV